MFLGEVVKVVMSWHCALPAWKVVHAVATFYKKLRE